MSLPAQTALPLTPNLSLSVFRANVMDHGFVFKVRSLPVASASPKQHSEPVRLSVSLSDEEKVNQSSLIRRQ